MIQEKICLKLSQDLIDFIDSDCLQFGILKKDRSPNRNAFFNQLISSYQLWGKKAPSFPFESAQKNDKGIIVGFKPNKETFLLIEKIRGESPNFSSYRKEILETYRLLGQDKRESFLYYDVFLEAKKAIESKKCLLCLLKNEKQEEILLEPYGRKNSNPEMRFYLLGLRNGKFSTIRISKIKKAMLLDKPCRELTKAQQERFRRAELYGPQYKYAEDDEEIAVRLDSFGVACYKKMYVYRPIPEKVEDDVWYFHCSPDQFFNYFIRLGNVVTILKPDSRKNRFKSFYRKALNRLP